MIGNALNTAISKRAVGVGLPYTPHARNDALRAAMATLGTEQFAIKVLDNR